MATVADIERELFGPSPKVFCQLAEVDDKPAGFALWYYTYSTFQGRHGIWLEDLFVNPEMRGYGVGKALLADLAQRCIREGLGRYEWNVLDWNQPSIDFYISQGYTDIALDTLEMLEKEFTAHPAIEQRRAKLRDMGVKASKPVADEFVGNEVAWDAPAAPGAEPSMVGMMMPEAELAPAGSNGKGPAVRSSIDSGLADIFEEFRVAAETEEDSPEEDYETHYNMGLAYKEMDLLDEAVREFQTAVGLTKPKDDASRFLSCCNMLGHCFMQKSLPKAAAIWFKKGLEAPGLAEEEHQALRYELASAFEQMGEVDNFHSFILSDGLAQF